MSEDIECQLRAALRPVAPREQFSEQLLGQVMRGRAQTEPQRFRMARRPLAWWLSASLAASLVLALGVHEHLQQRRMQQSGLEARREVLEALRMTSQKLDLAYEAVKSESTPSAGENTGV